MPSKPGRSRAWCWPLFAVAVALTAVACRNEMRAAPPRVVLALGEQERAERLFAEHCAVCHGFGGRSDGAALAYLYPPPRDFSFGRFRLATTENGVPSDGDLVRTLARGMPGSAMPAWHWMPERDLWILADHVRALSRRALVEVARAAVDATQQPFDEAAARATAARRLEPGRAVTLPGEAHYKATSSERGRALYTGLCVPCHGADGRGKAPESSLNEDGSLNWARDFTAGFQKGGATRDALAARIVVGLPGSSMTGNPQLSLQDLASLVAHVERLIPAGSDRRLVHREQEIFAARTNAPAPTEPEDGRWASAAETEIVLAPLSWHDGAVLAADVSAFHDGTVLAVRVRWSDATRDDTVLEGVPNCDALALAFSNEEAPPLFGMGSHERPVNLWHWRAARLIDTSGMLDLLEARPHLLRDPAFPESRLDVAPLYVPALGSPLSGGETRELAAEAVGAVRSLEEGGLPVAASARWEAGRWTVVLTRALAGRAPGEVVLAPGTRTVLSCAAWNGSSGDRGGSKSISIWQHLVLE